MALQGVGGRLGEKAAMGMWRRRSSGRRRRGGAMCSVLGRCFGAEVAAWCGIRQLSQFPFDWVIIICVTI